MSDGSPYAVCRTDRAHEATDNAVPHRHKRTTMKTDTQLQHDVIAELAWEPSVNAAQIGVEVKDGVVTLAGHVGSFVEKWEAERAAQRVSGVKGLAVEMDVNLPGSSKRNDVDIARAARNVLEWTTYWPQDEIKVVVEAGWVTLTGEVDWEYQRQAASNSIRGLIGITGVRDQIVIKPKAQGNGTCRQIGHRGGIEEANSLRRKSYIGRRQGYGGHTDRHGP